MTDPYAPPSSEVSGARISPVAPGKIEVTYTNNLFDIVFDQIGVYWRNPVTALIFAAALCWLAYENALDQTGAFHLQSFFVEFATLFAIIFGSITAVSLLLTGFAIWRGSAEAVRGPFRLELTDEGVTRETSTQRLLLKWRGVYAVRLSRWYLRIYLTPNAHFLVPRRAFILEQDVENFHLMAKQRCQAAKPPKPAKPAKPASD